MGNNKIEIFQNNDLSTIATITGVENLSGFTATMNVKENVYDEAILFTITGTSLTSTTIQFDIPASETDITPNNYNYDVTITDGSHTYTAIQDVLTIKDR